mmetsp:Transcript_14601/g.39504  ORF Transcript_14601/g.39504 Transcript_14601/m.39504 type:complete len:232 (-) Transcript_14601:48-743(-)
MCSCLYATVTGAGLQLLLTTWDLAWLAPHRWLRCQMEALLLLPVTTSLCSPTHWSQHPHVPRLPPLSHHRPFLTLFPLHPPPPLPPMASAISILRNTTACPWPVWLGAVEGPCPYTALSFCACWCQREGYVMLAECCVPYFTGCKPLQAHTLTLHSISGSPRHAALLFLLRPCMSYKPPCTMLSTMALSHLECSSMWMGLLQCSSLPMSHRFPLMQLLNPKQLLQLVGQGC